MIKKIIRGILKIPVTTFYVIVLMGLYYFITMIQFFKWVYDSGDEWDRNYNKTEKKKILDKLKKWFTTI
jgi:hypothetical protein